MYYHSSQDFFNVGFYCFVWITIHAAVQKYIWKVCVCLFVCICVEVGLFCDAHSKQ